ncbi:hypothetical protein L1987_85060 [Smallanthus sonchifolius]|uniref:Uncharacterized protein n=1 Tax=Smallanthus sonchifolius TaxID=185202 RepID=A0ACB8XZN3_9ASTR|nr:hypothetical protein L1987_85060 [Smallanthus sonchifolius]
MLYRRTKIEESRRIPASDFHLKIPFAIQDLKSIIKHKMDTSTIRFHSSDRQSKRRRLAIGSVSKDKSYEVNFPVKLRHPNIVPFLGAVTEKKPLMLITEFLRGVLLIAQLIVNINKESFSPKIHYNDLWVIGHQCLKENGALNPTTIIVRKHV